MKRLRLTGVAGALGLAAALGLAITTGVPVATAATAAPARPAAPAVTHACTSGWVCVYADANYFDGPALFRTSNSYWGVFSSHGACVAGSTAAKDDTNGSWNDCMSSVHNESSVTMLFMSNAGCQGFSWPLSPGQSLASVSDLNGHNFNDSISSDEVGDSC
jgi:hypothetical protein